MADKSFTRSGMGTGKSDDVSMEKLPNGDKLMRTFGLDNTHGVELANSKGGTFKGGMTDLSHSLTGTSAVQK